MNPTRNARPTISILGILLFACLCPGTALADPLQVRYYQTHFRYSFERLLLREALLATEAVEGPFELVPWRTDVAQERGIMLLEQRRIDVVFLPTSREREKRLQAIRRPVLFGLLGYRLLLVRRDRFADFSAVRSLADLRNRFVAGFGAHWADLDILRANGLHVAVNTQYEGLFDMLSAGRFDYFPRGVNEIWQELRVSRVEHPDLDIEPGLALYYPYPVYYFVHRDNEELAGRIGRGMEILTANGTHRSLFLRHHGDSIRRAELHRRMVLELPEIPSLPEDAPLPDDSWWRSPTAP